MILRVEIKADHVSWGDSEAAMRRDIKQAIVQAVNDSLTECRELNSITFRNGPYIPRRKTGSTSAKPGTIQE
jgi:hypothetical protein